MTQALIIIPARMAAQRLPGKPLVDICGLPMIIQVLRRAEAAQCGTVYIAAGDQEIVDVVTAHGGKAVLTDPSLPSGTDRVKAAADIIDPDRIHDLIINLQGDMPFVDPSVVAATVAVLTSTPAADIATAIAGEDDVGENAKPSTVKAIMSFSSPEDTIGRAHYFTRSTLYGDGLIWKHLGIYGYRRAALDRFDSAPPSPLELREKLEQLRALEMGLSIHAAVVSSAPVSVDTPEDLQAARAEGAHFLNPALS